MPSNSFTLRSLAQLTAIGFLLAGDAGDVFFAGIFGASPLPIVSNIGLALLWVSGIVTLYTGYDYFTAGVRHLIKD